MAKLEHEKRPDGQRADYMFVVNKDTGRRFKVLHELKRARNGDPVLALSISPVDSSGKALLKDEGPDVTYHNRTLTEVELSDPNFDVEGVVAGLLAQMVDDKETELGNRAAVLNIGERWGTKAFNLTPPEA